MPFFHTFSTILLATFLHVVCVASNNSVDIIFDDFQCQTERISSADVKATLENRSKTILFRHQFPSTFTYRTDSGIHECLQYPIRNHEMSLTSKFLHRGYFVTYHKANGTLIGVVALSWFNTYVECVKATDLQLGEEINSKEALSINALGISGYQCGLIFFPLGSVLINFRKVQIKIFEKSSDFSEILGSKPGKGYTFKKWPLDYNSQLSTSKNSGLNSALGSYFLITDEDGIFLGMGFNTLSNPVEKCRISRKPYNSAVHSIKVQKGYVCDIFFLEEYILQSRDAASKRQQQKVTYLKILRTSKGENLLLWPLLANREIYQYRKPSKYFLALDSQYKIRGVVTSLKDNPFQICPLKHVLSGQDSETSDFICHESERVSNKDLIKLAGTACRFMKKLSQFPYTYKGPDFHIFGPYFAYPKGNTFSSSATFWVVITHDCKIAGVLFGTDKNLLKCKRTDGSTPGGNREQTIEVHPRVFDTTPSRIKRKSAGSR